MIINNTSTEIGDILTIKTDVPILGVVLLSSFVDDTVNEDVNKYFNKTFRYSVDGITWSDFFELTTLNIQNVLVNPTNTLFLEYYYERNGTDASGDLEFNSITLGGQFQQLIAGPAFNNTIFKTYLGDPNNLCSIAWSINVLEKIYKSGILPNYITRNVSATNLEDQDFIDFWRSVTHYFALFVCLARHFQTFYTDPTLLLEYLNQRGLYICNDTLYEDLIYLMSNYFDEIRQRGSIQVVTQKGDDTHGLFTPKGIDGEYLRLICFDKRDEFIFNLNKNESIGWNIGSASPMYNGLEGLLNINKFYFDDQIDLNKLPLINPSNISIFNDTSISKDVIKIENVTIGQVSGIGLVDSSKFITINPNFDYEFTAFIKQPTHPSKISFGIKGFDVNNNSKNLLQLSNLVPGYLFLSDVQLSSNGYQFIRGVLINKKKFRVYNSSIAYDTLDIVKYVGTYYKAKRNVPINTTPSTTPLYWEAFAVDDIEYAFLTNLNIGENLTTQSGVVKILPYLVLDNTDGSGGSLLIHSLRIQILNTKYSKGFIQTPNFLEIFQSNNNQQYSNEDVEGIAKRFLFPYNVTLKSNTVKSEVIE